MHRTEFCRNIYHTVYSHNINIILKFADGIKGQIEHVAPLENIFNSVAHLEWNTIMLLTVCRLFYSRCGKDQWSYDLRRVHIYFKCCVFIHTAETMLYLACSKFQLILLQIISTSWVRCCKKRDQVGLFVSVDTKGQIQHIASWMQHSGMCSVCLLHILVVGHLTIVCMWKRNIVEKTILKKLNWKHFYNQNEFYGYNKYGLCISVYMLNKSQNIHIYVKCKQLLCFWEKMQCRLFIYRHSWPCCPSCVRKQKL